MTVAPNEPWSPARPHVHAIAIELTGFCNQTCDYCYNPFRGDGGASVGSADVSKLFARLDRILDVVDLEHVTLTGGEPLASHDLFSVLDGLRARSVRAQIISNGTLVTDRIAERLYRYRLIDVLVTLNAPDAADHDALVRGREHFARTIEGIRRLRAHRVPVQGSIVITRANAAQVGATLARFHELGVKTVALSRFSPAGYAMAHAASLVPTPEHVTLALTQAAAHARANGTTLFATMPIPPCVVDRGAFPEIVFNDCPIGTEGQEFALGIAGEIRHCPLHAEPIARADDVLDPGFDLAKVFAPGDPHRYRAVLPTHCQGCEHASRCGGGCGAAAWWAHGSHTHVDPFVTSLLRKKSLPIVG